MTIPFNKQVPAVRVEAATNDEIIAFLETKVSEKHSAGKVSIAEIPNGLAWHLALSLGLNMIIIVQQDAGSPDGVVAYARVSRNKQGQLVILVSDSDPTGKSRPKLSDSTKSARKSFVIEIVDWLSSFLLEKNKEPAAVQAQAIATEIAEEKEAEKEAKKESFNSLMNVFGTILVVVALAFGAYELLSGEAVLSRKGAAKNVLNTLSKETGCSYEIIGRSNLDADGDATKFRAKFSNGRIVDVFVKYRKDAKGREYYETFYTYD